MLLVSSHMVKAGTGPQLRSHHPSQLSNGSSHRMSAAGSSSKTSDNSLDGPRVVWEPSMGLAWVPTSEFVGSGGCGSGTDSGGVRGSGVGRVLFTRVTIW